MEKHRGAFRSNICRLQTSTASIAGIDRIHTYPVFERYHTPTSVRRLGNLPSNFVHLAWAILLRSFTADDTVSFAVFPVNKCADRSLNSQSSHPERRDLPGDTQVLLYQYDELSELTLYDWVPVASWKVQMMESESIQVNTAVRHWISSPVKPPQSSCLDHSRFTQWLDVELNIGDENWLGGLFINVRSSHIPDEFSWGIARTLRTVLIELAASTELDIRQLNTVSAEDRRKIVSWHPTRPFASAKCLHEHVELTALSMPNAEAVCAWDGSLTYAELEAASYQIANQLVEAGTQVGDLIPFSFEKSMWAVVATLAILKAGAAFVPIDPKQPTARSKELLARLEAKIIVISERVQQIFLDIGIATVMVSKATSFPSSTDSAKRRALPIVNAWDPAFVLYTSGSTGEPKGILHEHGAAVTTAIANGERMGYNGRVFQFSAYTFDMSVWDMYSTLILGGCVCVPSDEDRFNNITESMNRMKVDFVFLTPSVTSLLQADDVHTLRTLACGGECFGQEIMRRWEKKTRLINSYGIAETGTLHLWYPDSNDKTSRTETVGFMPPTVIGVLVDPNNHNRLVPIGAVGELLVAGSTLARGYLNDDETTRSRFLSDLAWADDLGLQGKIFFKTGDLLQYNITSYNGKYDFIRRKDGQIKFHGQRMEAGEVEYHLRGIDGVALAAVVFPRSGCLAGQIISVVQSSLPSTSPLNQNTLCLNTSHHLQPSTMKKRLSRILPGYMIPSVFLAVHKIPLTANGKIDRKIIMAWLESKVPKSERTMSLDSETTLLSQDEITARSISGKIADMLSFQDTKKRSQFEGRDFRLQKVGIDSIQTSSLAMFIQKEYEVKLPMNILLNSVSTVRNVACFVDKRKRFPKKSSPDTTNFIDFLDNAPDILSEVGIHSADILDHVNTPSCSIKRDQMRPVTQNILMTGASGYLGSAILRQLLQRSQSQIFALTRCPTKVSALEKIRQRATANGWWQEGYVHRIHLWSGDLKKPNLGLGTVELIQLRGETRPEQCIHAILHNGAVVNYNQDYKTLLPSNVRSTKELLSLMTVSSCISSLIYVSGGRPPTAIDLVDSIDAQQANSMNGYGQSKFVAEYIVRQCMSNATFRDKGLRIVRPGYIIGSPQTGLANQSDFIWRLIAGCIEINAYDEEEQDHWLYISDVDRVAEVVTCPINTHDEFMRQKIDHVLDGIFFSDLWTILKAEFGYELKPVAHTLWLQRLQSVVEAKGESHLLFPLLYTLERSAGRLGSAVTINMNPGNGEGVRDAIRANVRHLIAEGFLQAPPNQVG